MNKYGYVMNTKKSKPDKRDYKLRVSGISLPDKVSITHNLPIRSQQNIGSCMAHAAVRAVEIQLLSKRKWFLEGSELYHYFMARKYVDNSFPNDSGMTVRDGCKTIQKYGASLEMLWPYNTKNYNQEPSNVAKLLSSLVKASSYYRLIHISQIKECIYKGIPVVCGVRVDTNYYSLMNSNKSLWIPSGKIYGGHAQVLTGYDDSKGLLTLENSWGINFGDNGKCYVSYSDFSKVSFDWYAIQA